MDTITKGYVLEILIGVVGVLISAIAVGGYKVVNKNTEAIEKLTIAYSEDRVHISHLSKTVEEFTGSCKYNHEHLDEITAQNRTIITKHGKRLTNIENKIDLKQPEFLLMEDQ